MNGLVDTHCHILPGLDDGPADLDLSLNMARAAVEAGVTAVAATPHLRADFPKVAVDELAGHCESFRSTIARHGIDLDIVVGAEISLAWALDASDDELRLASYGQRGRYVLIEPPVHGGQMLLPLLDTVRARGFEIVLAHPERLEELAISGNLADALLTSGMILEVNAESLFGRKTKAAVRSSARMFCDAGLATIVASDAHSGTDRRPIIRLSEARHHLTRLVGPGRATWMLETAPAAILAGEDIPAWVKSRSGLLRRVRHLGR